MAIVAIIAKIMPESPDVDLEVLKSEAEKRLTPHGAQNISFEIKPIAFGLKAVMVKFAWPEEKDTDLVEKTLGGIENVASATIEDYRRAFG